MNRTIIVLSVLAIGLMATAVAWLVSHHYRSEPKAGPPIYASGAVVDFAITLQDGHSVLTDADLVGYEWPTHTLILQPAVADRISKMVSDTGDVNHGASFSVWADGVVCYKGVFTTEVSSFSQKGVVILDFPREHSAKGMPVRLPIKLGYPAPQFFEGEDPRSDPRIRAALAKSGKLRE